MKKIYVSVLSLALACALVLSGCAPASPGASPSPSQSAALEESAASASAPGNTFTDMLGNQVTIKATDKIISLAPSTTETLYALGDGDKIIGVDSSSNYPADAKTKPVVGDFNGPNVEKIVSISPDVVFCGNTLQKDQIAQMQNLGLTVVATEAVSFDDIPKSIELMGSIMGKQDAAKAIVDKINTAVADAKQKAPKSQKSVYYVMSFGDAGNWTSGPGSFINTIIATAGGTPITKDAKDEWLDYPTESLVKADPDIIMVASDAGSLDDLKKTQGYTDLTAIKNGKVYVVDADVLSRPGPRIADAISMVSDLLNK